MERTRPEAIEERMDAASIGLEGGIRSLARMLARVDYEHDEDKRVFGCSRAPAEAYVRLREAARQAVDEASAGADTSWACRKDTPSATRIVFKSFEREPTAVFPNGRTMGRIPCFSCRDGHFDAAAGDIEQWPGTEPTQKLLTELGENFWPA